MMKGFSFMDGETPLVFHLIVGMFLIEWMFCFDGNRN